LFKSIYKWMHISHKSMSYYAGTELRVQMNNKVISIYSYNPLSS